MLDGTGRYDVENFPGSKRSEILFLAKKLIAREVYSLTSVDPDNNVAADVSAYTTSYTITITQPTGATISPVNGETWLGYPYQYSKAFSITPDTDYTFFEWGDDASGVETTCTIVVDAAKTVSAVVEEDAELTVAYDADECTITYDPVLPGSGKYPHDTVVSITCVPESGWDFASWSGADVPEGHTTDNPLELTMADDKAIQANCSEE